MKKTVSLIFIVIAAIVCYATYNIFGSNVKAPTDKYFYIKTGQTYESIIQDLKDKQIVQDGFFFNK
ncbi:MAG: hypothetical protein ABL929_07865, partial [Ferruginibacter sp.]